MAALIKPIIAGSKFNKLTVTDDLGIVGKRHMVTAVCSCGKSKNFRLDQIKSGIAKSCGCLQREFCLTGKARYKHGDSGTRFNRIWAGMCGRTTKHLQDKYFKSYGRLGIKICERWKNYTFFKSDMYKSYIVHLEKHGEKQTTLDRINPKDNYSKNNCRWATWKEQSNNKLKNYGK